MTDVGREDLEAAYLTGSKNEAIQIAILELHKIQAIDEAVIPAYARERLEMELGIFEEWFFGHLLHQPTMHLSDYAPLLSLIEMQPTCCIHRDFHCRNILYDRAQIGIVDFQDALAGPALYDLASLLRDCYYTFSEREVDQWLEHYLSTSTPTTDALNQFEYAHIRKMLDYTAIQRQLKAIGIFARLHFRDRKSAHLQYITPVLKRLTLLTELYTELEPLHLQLSNCMNSTALALSDINEQRKRPSETTNE